MIMKTLIKFSLLAILAVVGFSSCTEEGITGGGSGGGTGGGGAGGGGTVVGPSVLLLTEADFVSFEATVMPEESFSVRMQAESGDNPLDALTITENGDVVDFSRITIDGEAAASNPILLFNDDKVNFTKDITVVSQSGESESTYTFSVADEAMNEASSAVFITTEVVILPPTILVEGSGMAMIAPGTIFGVPLTVADVTTPLSTISVLQDGVAIDADRLWYDDVTVQFPTNPAQLPDVDKLGLMRTIFVRVHADSGLRTYTFELTDEDNQVFSRDITIETGASVTSLDGVLFNRAGPSGTGGLDLDNGMSVGSTDGSAEIKDEGIDNGPVESNWIRRISGANGAEVRHLFNGQNGLADNFEFDNVTTAGQVAALWDNGVSFVDTNADGDGVSLRVEQGDLFTISANNTFYLIRISQVVETVDNNQDNYMVDIRF
jgi:hypothetical protein